MDKRNHSNKDGHVGHARHVDSGWAWVVMTTTYIGMTLYCITLYMNGVIYIALLEHFHDDKAKTALVGAINSGLLCFTAPIAGAVNSKLSCRFSIILGGFLTTLGFVASAFVQSLNWMILTAGVFIGAGYGFSSCGLICVAGFYFEKWRDQVLSGAFMVLGISLLVSAPFGLYLLDNFGMSTTFLILGAIQAQMCVLGMLSRPSHVELAVQAQKKRDIAERRQSVSKAYIDMTLLVQKSYTLFLCSTTTWNLALSVATMHLPNYISTLGGSSSDIAWLMTSFAIANLIGRMLGLLTVNILHERCIRLHVIALGAMGVLTTSFPLYAHLPGAPYVFAIQIGVFAGMPNSMMTPISLSYVGVAKLSEAYGLAYIFCGMGSMSGPILIGYLFGVTRSYEYSFVATGLVSLVGFVCGIGALCCGKPAGDSAQVLIVDPEGQKMQDKCAKNEKDISGYKVPEHELLLVDPECQKTEIKRANTDKKEIISEFNGGTEHEFLIGSVETGANISDNETDIGGHNAPEGPEHELLIGTMKPRLKPTDDNMEVDEFNVKEDQLVVDSVWKATQCRHRDNAEDIGTFLTELPKHTDSKMNVGESIAPEHQSLINTEKPDSCVHIT